MFLRSYRLIVLLCCAAILSACETTTGTKEEQQPAPVTGPAGQVGEGSGAVVSGAEAGGVTRGSPLDDPQSLLSNRTVYFEYDQSAILGPDRPVIEAHGRFLADHPTASVTLEGHADERGSREYNIALGEARATAVRQLMSLLGASGSQIRTVSYGEERPVAEEHDESAWSQNRRVEIIYRTR
jgi:peptidoglycan-associated lipoprotein